MGTCSVRSKRRRCYVGRAGQAHLSVTRATQGRYLWFCSSSEGQGCRRAGGQGCRRHGSCLVDLKPDILQGPLGAISWGSIFRARALEGAAGTGTGHPGPAGWAGGRGGVERECPGAGASHIITQEACSRRCFTLRRQIMKHSSKMRELTFSLPRSPLFTIK